MEMLIGAAGAVWVVAAAAFTFGVARAAATERPYHADSRRELGLLR